MNKDKHTHSYITLYESHLFLWFVLLGGGVVGGSMFI